MVNMSWHRSIKKQVWGGCIEGVVCGVADNVTQCLCDGAMKRLVI